MLPVLIRAIGSRLLTREALGTLVKQEGTATALNVLSSLSTNRKDGERVVKNNHSAEIDATPVEKLPFDSSQLTPPAGKVGSDANNIFSTNNKSSEFNSNNINKLNNTKSLFNSGNKNDLNDPVYQAGYRLGQLIASPFRAFNRNKTNNNQEINSQTKKTNELITSILQLFNITNQKVSKTLIADSFLYEQLEKIGELINNLSTQISNAYKEKKAELIEDAARNEEKYQEDFAYRSGRWAGDRVRSVFDKLRPNREEPQGSADDDSSSGHSFGWLNKFGKEKSALAPNVKQELSKTGKVRYRDVKTGRFVSKEAAQAVKKQGLLDKGLSVGKGILGKLISPTKKAAVIETMRSSRAASLFEKVAAKASAASAKTAIGTGIIRKLATPILEKAIGKTVLKSIPIVGAVVGLGFAAQRLIEGDVVGAGLDAVSGLAGPLTAVPALIASVSRDIYSSVFGVQPEDDPNFGTNIGKVTDSVKDIAEDMIKGQIENSPVKPQQPPTASSKPKIPTAANDNKQAVPTAKPSPTATEPPKANNSSTSSGQASSEAETATPSDNKQASGDVGSTTKPTESTPQPPGGTSESNSPSSSITPPPEDNKQTSPVAQSPISTEQLTPADTDQSSQNMQMQASPKIDFKNNANDTGKIIKEFTESINKMSSPTFVSKDKTPTITPARSPTTKQGTVGIGNVPDPNYGNFGSITEQLYFRAAA